MNHVACAPLMIDADEAQRVAAKCFHGNDPHLFSLQKSELMEDDGLQGFIQKYFVGQQGGEENAPIAFPLAGIYRLSRVGYDLDRMYLDVFGLALHYICECNRGDQHFDRRFHPRVLETPLLETNTISDIVEPNLYTDCRDVIFCYHFKDHYLLVHVELGSNEDGCVGKATIYDYGGYNMKRVAAEKVADGVIMQFVNNAMGVKCDKVLSPSPNTRSRQGKGKKKSDNNEKSNPHIIKEWVRVVDNFAPVMHKKGQADYRDDSLLCGILVMDKALKLLIAKDLIRPKDLRMDDMLGRGSIDNWPVRWIFAVAMARMCNCVIADIVKMQGGDLASQIGGWDQYVAMFARMSKMSNDDWWEFLNGGGSCPFAGGDYADACCTEKDALGKGRLLQQPGLVYNCQSCCILECCLKQCHVPCLRRYLSGPGATVNCMRCGKDNPDVYLFCGAQFRRKCKLSLLSPGEVDAHLEGVLDEAAVMDKAIADAISSQRASSASSVGGGGRSKQPSLFDSWPAAAAAAAAAREGALQDGVNE
jgi:hypothetical protein